MNLLVLGGTWFKEAQAQVCTFIFLCLMLNAKLEATSDLDVYLKTLKIAQITFDYNQEHLHLCSIWQNRIPHKVLIYCFA